MPIDRSKYPDNWEELSRWIRFTRASGKCEGIPGHKWRENCKAVHGRPSPYTGAMVVLTVAHLDHDTRNNDLENLRALCQYCHLNYDRDENITAAAREKRAKALDAGQLDMFDDKGVK